MTASMGAKSLARVVVEVHSGAPSDAALEAALRLAKALGSTLEGVLVEDAEMLAMDALPCTRVVSLVSGRTAVLEGPGQLAREMRMQLLAARRRMEELASRIGLSPQFATVRGSLASWALAERLAERVAGAVLALTEPYRRFGAHGVAQLFHRLPELAGLVLAGPRARRRPGPLVVVIEDERMGVGQVEELFALAAALKSAFPHQLVALVVGRDGESGHAEALARRLAGGARPSRRDVGPGRSGVGPGRGEASEAVEIVWAEVPLAEPGVVAEALRRLDAGFVLAQSGGLFTPGTSSLGRLLAVLESPVLVVR